MASCLSLGADLDLRISDVSLGPYDVCPGASIYWRGVNEGRVLIRRCDDCGAHSHPRQESCESCFSPNLRWVEASGGGEVYTFSTVHRPRGERPTPYTLGMVRLDEGVVLFAEISPAADVHIGARVVPAFVDTERGTLLEFRLAETS